MGFKKWWKKKWFKPLIITLLIIWILSILSFIMIYYDIIHFNVEEPRIKDSCNAEGPWSCIIPSQGMIVLLLIVVISRFLMIGIPIVLAIIFIIVLITKIKKK